MKFQFYNLRLHILIVIIISLLCTNHSLSEFSFQQLEVKILVQENGTTKIIENYNIYIIGNNSLTAYDYTLKKSNNLESWNTLLGSFFHLRIKPEFIDPESISISGTQLYNCNTFDETCHANLSITYNGRKGEGGIFNYTRVKPRTLRYSLNKAALNFGRTEDNTIFLEDKENLIVYIPKSAKITQAYPETQTLIDSQIVWHSASGALSNFVLEFETEMSIAQEINEFSGSLEKKLNDFMQRKDFPLWILLIAMLFISIMLLIKKKIL